MPANVRRIWLLMDPGTMHAWQMVTGICRFARTRNWFLTIHNNNQLSPRQLQTAQVDGVIGLLHIQKLVDTLVANRTPAVNLARGPQIQRITSVLVDDEACGRIAAEYLLARRFVHYAFLGFENPEAAFSVVRRDGFTQRLAQEGDAVRLHTIDVERVRNMRNKLDEAAEGALDLDWLRALPKPIAVFCMYDPIASDLAAACLMAGVRVPEEVAILGVHNGQIACEMSNPPLSSVDTASEHRGYLAAQLLDEQFNHPDLPIQARVVPPVGVVSRASTDVVAVDDPVVVEAMRYIHAHVSEGIDVNSVVRAIAMSRRQLEKRFRKAMNRTPHDEIYRLRIARAMNLLATTALPMNEVAHQAGYRRQDRMAKAVRLATGQAPTKYRARFQHAYSGRS